MALPTVDMDDCCEKKLCTFGDNKGLAYNTCEPCRGLSNVVFDQGKCDCKVYSRYWRFNGTYTQLSDNASPTYDSPSCCVAGTTPVSSSFATRDIDFGPNNEVTFTGFVVDGYPMLSTQVLDEQGACCIEFFCRANVDITYREQFGVDLYTDSSPQTGLVDANTVLWRRDSGPGFTNGNRSVWLAEMALGSITIIVELSDGTSGGIKCVESEWDSLEAIPIDSGGNPL